MNEVVAVRRGNPGYSLEAKAEIIDYVLEQIAHGRALSRILKEDEGMPSITCFWRWIDEDKDLEQKVERAREIGASTILDEIVEIADTDNADAYVEYDKDGTARAKIDGEAIQRSKLRVYAREKYAQMIAPRRYGAKLDLSSGGEPLKPAQLTDNRVQAIVGLAVERKMKALQHKKPEGED